MRKLLGAEIMEQARNGNLTVCIVILPDQKAI